MTLRYGQPAPDFSLPSTLGHEVTLRQFQGQADLVLVFFCYSWGSI